MESTLKATSENFVRKSNKVESQVVKDFKKGLEDLKHGRYEDARTSNLFN